MRSHTWTPPFAEAWNTTWDIAWSGLDYDHRILVWNNIYAMPAPDTLRAALLALIAYDSCAYLLDQDPYQVKFLSELRVDSATLLYPACLILSLEKKK
jgi:hypothetical protein